MLQDIRDVRMIKSFGIKAENIKISLTSVCDTHAVWAWK